MDHNVITENMAAWREFGFWMDMTDHAQDTKEFTNSIVSRLSPHECNSVVTLLGYGIDNLSTEELENLWISGSNNQSVYGDIRELFEKLLNNIKNSQG